MKVCGSSEFTKSLSVGTDFSVFTDVHVGLDMGRLIQECRLKQGLSQKELAAVRLASTHPECILHGMFIGSHYPGLLPEIIPAVGAFLGG